MIVEYELLGKDFNPVNRQDITLEINHDQESVINQPRPHVGINNLYFSREDLLNIMAYLNTPPGITEGAPFNIRVTEKNQTEIINMYLDFMNGFKRSNDGISCAIVMLQSLDWLDNKTDGFTLESMYNETGVVPFYIDGILYNSFQQFMDKRCIYIPYVISTIPDKQNAFMALLSVVFICIQIYRAIKDIVEAAEVWVQLLIEAPFVIALVFTLIALIERMINFLIQPLKYHGAMLLVDMLKIVAHKLGLEFKSSIWESYPFNQVAYLPEKYQPPQTPTNAWTMMTGFQIGGFGSESAKDARVGGYTSPAVTPNTVHDSNTPNIQHGYMNGTGGDVLRLVKKICNGKIIIPDQTDNLVLERRDYSLPASTYQLPDIRQDWNGYNTDELFANILIRFEADLNDKNCIDKYDGTILQAVHSQILTNDQRLVLLKGLREVQLGVARGIRKEGLTDTEETLKNVIDIMNKWKPLIIAFLNANIVTANGAIFAANGALLLINGLILSAIAVVNTINLIIDAVNLIPGVNISPINIPSLHTIALIQPIAPINNATFPNSSLIDDRTGALLLENDFVDVPKIVMIDMGRAEWNQKRIAFLHKDNATTVHAKNLWDKFYFIDAFVGAINNRFTKISPANNHDTDANPTTLSLAQFKSLVSNPKINDNFGEEVITDSVQWRIGDESGMANFAFRKQGWLKNPQSNNGAIRSQEININMDLKLSVPNGQ